MLLLPSRQLPPSKIITSELLSMWGRRPFSNATKHQSRSKHLRKRERERGNRLKICVCKTMRVFCLHANFNHFPIFEVCKLWTAVPILQPFAFFGEKFCISIGSHIARGLQKSRPSHWNCKLYWCWRHHRLYGPRRCVGSLLIAFVWCVCLTHSLGKSTVRNYFNWFFSFLFFYCMHGYRRALNHK